MKHKDIRKIIEVSKMYYQEDKSQQEISVIMGISRPQISRMLRKAKEMGFVSINIIDPDDNIGRLKTEFKNKFNLKDIIIIDTETDDTRLIKKALARQAASYVSTIIRPGDILGISWGTTVQEITNYIDSKKMDYLTFVQLKGVISNNLNSPYALEAIAQLSKKFNSKCIYLPVPAVVSNPEVKEALMTDANIKTAIDYGNKANIALFSIGYSTDRTFLTQTGYIDVKTLKNMAKQGAVGDICNRYYDINGEIFDKDLDNRTMSIELDELKNKNYSIAVSGGIRAAKSILGALRGGYMNVLVTDVTAAEAIINISGA